MAAMPKPMKRSSSSVAEILARPYARVLEREPDGRYAARVLEFPGCFTEGDDPAHAIAQLDEVLTMFIEDMIEQGEAIPDPIASSDHTGRLTLRLPPALHHQAAKLAAAQGESLNRFICDAVARHVGASAAVPKPRAKSGAA